MNDEICFNTDNLRIEKNFISIDDEVLLQISNVSYISIIDPPQKKFRVWTLLLLVAGIILSAFKDINEQYLFIGILLILGELFYVVIIFIVNSDNGEKYLCINMNSGSSYTIFCKSEQFLKRVIEVIECCINNHSGTNVKIDFDNCEVYNSPITIGKGNEVKNEIKNI